MTHLQFHTMVREFVAKHGKDTRLVDTVVRVTSFDGEPAPKVTFQAYVNDLGGYTSEYASPDVVMAELQSRVDGAPMVGLEAGLGDPEAEMLS